MVDEKKHPEPAKCSTECCDKLAKEREVFTTCLQQARKVVHTATDWKGAAVGILTAGLEQIGPSPEAKPTEPALIRCDSCEALRPSAEIDHHSASGINLCKDGKHLPEGLQRLYAEMGVMDDLKAQLAAAQERVDVLVACEKVDAKRLKAATERAERAERERDGWKAAVHVERVRVDHYTAERDAAIKAKEEAERELENEKELTATNEYRFIKAREQRDAERSRADDCKAALEIVRGTRDEYVEKYRTERATAGALRAALAAALEELEAQAGGPQDQTEEEAALLQQCREALAAHSKAVGP